MAVSVTPGRVIGLTDQIVGQVRLTLAVPTQGSPDVVAFLELELLREEELLQDIGDRVLRVLVCRLQNPDGLAHHDLVEIDGDATFRRIRDESGDDRRLVGIVSDEVPDEYVRVESCHGFSPWRRRMIWFISSTVTVGCPGRCRIPCRFRMS